MLSLPDTHTSLIDQLEIYFILTDLKKLFGSLFVLAFLFGFGSDTVSAQGRERVIRTTSSSQPTNLPPNTTETVRPTTSTRPVLTNEIRVVGNGRADAAWEPPVERTASTTAVNAAAAAAAGRSAYSAAVSNRIDQAIKSRYGIRYRYGTSGPNTYDCSGFVWSVFQEAGLFFTRQSARSLWSQSEPVYGDDRFKYGTLVFLNGLGHMGIVADENGFYHASSSKGITYSPFKGYWGNRIVGFRKLVPESTLPDVK